MCYPLGSRLDPQQLNVLSLREGFVSCALSRASVPWAAALRAWFTELGVPLLYVDVRPRTKATWASCLWWGSNPWPMAYRSLVGETKPSPRGNTFSCWGSDRVPSRHTSKTFPEGVDPPQQIEVKQKESDVNEEKNYSKDVKRASAMENAWQAFKRQPILEPYFIK